MLRRVLGSFRQSPQPVRPRDTDLRRWSQQSSEMVLYPAVPARSRSVPPGRASAVAPVVPGAMRHLPAQSYETAIIDGSGQRPRRRAALGVPSMFNNYGGESPSTNLMEVKDSEA